MKKLKETIEIRAYSEEEAKNFLEDFRKRAKEDGYTVGSIGYKYKEKRSKGIIVDQAWICKCVKIFDGIWDEED